MNRMELIRKVASNLRDKGVRKPVYASKKVFHISDDEGNKKDFEMHVTDKKLMFTIADIEQIFDEIIDCIVQSIMDGDPVTIRSFGSFGLKYYKPRMSKDPTFKKDIKIGGGFYPRFTPLKDLKLAARLFSKMQADKGVDLDSLRTEDIGIGDDDGSGNID